MISLILTCRVGNKKRQTSSAVSHGMFTPVPYPSLHTSFAVSSYEILFKTIRSYSGVSFKSAIFRIEVDEDDQEIKAYLFENIIREIKHSISAEFIDISDNRPQSKDQWISFVSECSKYISDEPILVSMNHDHMMNGDCKTTFVKLVERLNKKDPSLLLAYSHIPEAMSWAMMGVQNKTYTGDYIADFGLVKISPSKWLDCLYVMKLGQLNYIFTRMSETPSYLPRFDWAGVKFKKMMLRLAVLPFPFFRHYDGYGHVTGIRIARLISSEINDRLMQASATTASAYREFIEVFYIYLRDSLAECDSDGSKRRIEFIKIVEQCFDIFLRANIRIRNEESLNEGQIQELFQEIRELFYYDFNLIYCIINEDAKLISRNKLRRIIEKTLRRIIGMPSRVDR